MIILRNKSFSKKNEDKNTKLNLSDRIEVWGDKHLNNQSGRDYKREYLKGNKDTPVPYKKALITGTATGFPITTTAIPLITGKDPKLPLEEFLKGNYKKAVLLSSSGALTSQMLNKVAGNLNKSKLKKNPHANDKAIDRLDVAEGKMSKEDFAKKWYKK